LLNNIIPMSKTFSLFQFKISGVLHFWGGFLFFFLLSFAAGAQVTVTVTGTNVTCYGLNNGSATAVASGGTAPYTYLWSNGANTPAIANLAPGTYSVTATDASQNTAVGSVQITQPNQLGVSVTGTNQICDIAPDGTATAFPGNGTPPYNYLWNNGGTTPQITGLAAGTYTVTVTDANACTASGSYLVEYWPEGIWLMDSTVDVTCFGFNNGFSHIGAMSGTPPYTYLWSTGATTEDVYNLAPGDYSVTVTDANDCYNIWNVTVEEPPLLTCNAASIPSLCGLPGSASVNPSGGVPPYNVLWSNGSTNFTITAPPGDYSVTVTDANDCICTDSVTILNNSSGLNVTATVNSNAGCTIGGDATASASGGTGNYAYSWDNGQTTATATNLTAGNHSVTVTDFTTGCSGTATVNVPAAPQLTATATLVSNATCLTGGSATASANGGTPAYSFLWDNGQTTATATSLGAGPHSVTITDTKGCTAAATTNIGQNQGPNVTAQVTSNATCTTGGSATATATVGTPPYVYLWDNGQTTAAASNLSVGTHMVTVTDAGGCSASASVSITQPNAPILTIINITNAGCIGGGSATVAASGGTLPYSYLWSNGAIGPTATNLVAGGYTVTATDAASCTATLSVIVTGSIPPNVVITASSNAKCDQPGSATASATGGTGNYNYKWDNNETTATATNLTPGLHSVTVTDAASCSATASVTIGFTNNGIKLGDYVWYDDDQNGFQNPLETDGVPNVIVKLIKAGPDGNFDTPDDQVVQTDTTNASGKYEFTCVTPGTYIIKFSNLPAGYEFTKQDYVNNDCKDSDPNSSGKIAPFTIVAGQNDNPCYDAGIHIFCDNVLNAGTICCNQTICEGETPALLYNTLYPYGGTGPIEYQWLQLVQMGPAPPIWTAIPGATSATYQPGPLFQTSYFMRCARRAGCVNFLESNIITITVKPAGSPGCADFTPNIDLSLLGKNSVQVAWTTTLPENEQYLYTVLHSTDLTAWETVTTVVGQHDVTQPSHYSIVHQTPIVGMNYYRLKRANSGGIETYSKINSIELDANLAAAISINPNPASDILIIKNVAEYEADVSVQIVSTDGRVLHRLTIPAGQLIYEEVPVANLPSGLYMVRILFPGDEVRTVKITKF
jgi:hypothetical protein